MPIENNNAYDIDDIKHILMHDALYMQNNDDKNNNNKY